MYTIADGYYRGYMMKKEPRKPILTEEVYKLALTNMCNKSPYIGLFMHMVKQAMHSKISGFNAIPGPDMRSHAIPLEDPGFKLFEWNITLEIDIADSTYDLISDWLKKGFAREAFWASEFDQTSKKKGYVLGKIPELAEGFVGELEKMALDNRLSFDDLMKIYFAVTAAAHRSSNAIRMYTHHYPVIVHKDMTTEYCDTMIITLSNRIFELITEACWALMVIDIIAARNILHLIDFVSKIDTKRKLGASLSDSDLGYFKKYLEVETFFTFIDSMSEISTIEDMLRYIVRKYANSIQVILPLFEAIRTHLFNQAVSIPPEHPYSKLDIKKCVPILAKKMLEGFILPYKLRGSPAFLKKYIEQIITNIVRTEMDTGFEKILKESGGIKSRTLRRYMKDQLFDQFFDDEHAPPKPALNKYSLAREIMGETLGDGQADDDTIDDMEQTDDNSFDEEDIETDIESSANEDMAEIVSKGKRSKTKLPTGRDNVSIHHIRKVQDAKAKSQRHVKDGFLAQRALIRLLLNDTVRQKFADIGISLPKSETTIKRRLKHLRGTQAIYCETEKGVLYYRESEVKDIAQKITAFSDHK